MQSLSTISSKFQTVSDPTPPMSTVNMQRMGTRCWRLLINQGVPFNDARELAIAITHFLYHKHNPSPEQKQLISRYYQQIKAAELSSLEV